MYIIRKTLLWLSCGTWLFLVSVNTFITIVLYRNYWKSNADCAFSNIHLPNNKHINKQTKAKLRPPKVVQWCNSGSHHVSPRKGGIQTHELLWVRLGVIVLLVSELESEVNNTTKVNAVTTHEGMNDRILGLGLGLRLARRWWHGTPDHSCTYIVRILLVCSMINRQNVFTQSRGEVESCLHHVYVMCLCRVK